MIGSYLLQPRKKRPEVGDPGGTPPVEDDSSEQSVYDRAAADPGILPPPPQNAAWTGDTPEAQQILRAAMLKPKDPVMNSMGAADTDPGNPSMAPKKNPGVWSQRVDDLYNDLRGSISKGRSFIPILGRSWDAETAAKENALRTALLGQQQEAVAPYHEAQTDYERSLAERNRAEIPYYQSRAYRSAGRYQDKTGRYHVDVIGPNGLTTQDTGVTGDVDIRKRAMLRNGELVTNGDEDIDYEDTAPYRAQGGAVVNRQTGEYSAIPSRIPTRHPGASPYDQRRAQVAMSEAMGLVPKGSLAQYDASVGSATLTPPAQGAASAPAPAPAAPGPDPLEGRTATGPNGEKVIRRNGKWVPLGNPAR